MRKLLRIVLTIGLLIPNSLPARESEGSGTRVGGGGNGVLGRPIESYVRILDGEQEYKDYIVPILNKLKNKLPNLANDLLYLVNHKNSYFVPVDLPHIPRYITGLYFRTDQLAIQTQTELWVDSQFYDKMRSRKDKATLLLHEMVMALYLKNNESFLNACSTVSGYECPLSSLQHSQVRRITHVLLEKTDLLSPSELVSELNNNGLNNYHYKQPVDLTAILTPPTVLEIYMMLNSELNSNNLPKTSSDFKGCGYVFKFNNTDQSLLVSIYNTDNGHPRVDTRPLQFQVIGQPQTTLSTQFPNTVQYTYIKKYNDTYRKKLIIELDMFNIRSVSISWEELTYNYRTKKEIWIEASKAPFVTLAPSNKKCL